MVLVIMGAPGAGKGTQATLLSKRFGIPHISTGEILRRNISAGTKLGKIADALINSGNLVSDQIMIDLVRERITEPDCARGYILDGFPRTLFQAQSLKAFAAVSAAINIEIGRNELIRRLSGRRVCRDCGKSYHISTHSGDKCDCNGQLITRDDDAEETVKSRIEVYGQKSEPLTGFYRSEELLMSVGGEGTPQQVFERIIERLSEKIG